MAILISQLHFWSEPVTQIGGPEIRHRAIIWQQNCRIAKQKHFSMSVTYGRRACTPGTLGRATRGSLWGLEWGLNCESSLGKRICERLNAQTVQAAKHPGGERTVAMRLHDGSGLHLQITATGGKSWVLRYRKAAGGEAWLGLGAYSKRGIGLAQARVAAEASREMLRGGVDPLAARVSARHTRATAGDRTFKAFALAHIADNVDVAGADKKSVAQWRTTLAAYAFPFFGGKDVACITSAEVQAAFRPIWTEKGPTARKLLGRVHAILLNAEAKGLRSGPNPARPSIMKHALPKQLTRKKHYPALPWAEVPAFCAALRKRKGEPARALEFLIFTVSRSREVREMRFDEVDMVAEVWRRPAARMKMRREHSVPLSPQALSIVRAQALQHPGSGIVFPNAKGTALSDMALSQVIRRMSNDTPLEWTEPATGRDVVPHGFRASFRTWGGEATKYEREVLEAALSHLVGDSTEKSYSHGEYLERRIPVMVDWSDLVSGMVPIG